MWGYKRNSIPLIYSTCSPISTSINKGFLKSVQVKLSNEKFVANAKPEVIESERDGVGPLVLDTMRGAAELSVPFEVHAAWGATWAAAKS